MAVVIALLFTLSAIEVAFAGERPFDAGRVALHEGNFDKAISLFTEDIHLHPENGAAYDNRGLAYLQKGELDRAIADFNVPIQMRPDDAHPYSNRAHAYENKGDLSKAIADYSRAIELDPNRADDYNNRGAIYGTQREWDKAIADFDMAIQKNPKLAEAYFNRGTVYYRKGQVARGIADFEEGLRIKPYDAEAIARLNMGKSAKPPQPADTRPIGPLVTSADIEKIALSHPAPVYPIDARRRIRLAGAFSSWLYQRTQETFPPLLLLRAPVITSWIGLQWTP